LPVNRIAFVQSSIGVQQKNIPKPAVGEHPDLDIKHPPVLARFFYSNPSILEVITTCILDLLVNSGNPTWQSKLHQKLLYGWFQSLKLGFPEISNSTVSRGFLCPGMVDFLSFLAVQSPNFRNFLAIQLTPNSKQLAPRQSWERTEHSGPSRGMGYWVHISGNVQCFKCFGF
jgi:hypothetical protein